MKFPCVGMCESLHLNMFLGLLFPYLFVLVYAGLSICLFLIACLLFNEKGEKKNVDLGG